MSTPIRGTIQKTSSRPWKGKTFYSLKVNDVWYSTGTKTTPDEGALVEFEADQNEKGYWDVTKQGIRVVQSEAPKTLAGVANKVNLSKDDYWTRKEDRDIETQKRIELQSARNSALALIEILVKTESLKLPAVNKRVEFFESILADYVKQFIAENQGKTVDENSDQPTDDEEQESSNGTRTDGDWNA